MPQNRTDGRSGNRTIEKGGVRRKSMLIMGSPNGPCRARGLSFASGPPRFSRGGFPSGQGPTPCTFNYRALRSNNCRKSPWILVSSVNSGWKVAARMFFCRACTTEHRYQASGSTPGPAPRICGARMNTA